MGELCMLLSRVLIRLLRWMRVIVIEPFRKSLLGPITYDVTLGEAYFVPNPQFTAVNLNPYDERNLRSYWQLRTAMTFGEARAAFPKIELNGFSPHDCIIVVPPRTMILCHTVEWIGGYWAIATMMYGKSRWRRVGLEVCSDSIVGNIGVNCWVMELNNDTDRLIPIRVGDAVAQIMFHLVWPVSTKRADGSNGTYNGSKKLELLMREWTPEKMLPRANGVPFKS